MVKIWTEQGRIHVGGIIINHHFKKVQRALEEMAGEESRMVVDLGELEFIDETGVSQLMGMIDRFNDRGIQVELINARDKVLARFLQVGARLWLDKQLFSKVG
ncbi:MAG: STAS domain-containing protein [Thermoanaerobacteraceae bacterium]|nr:STAS domain-containing protein [Thermoanaerobacteraceae bacterium]